MKYASRYLRSVNKSIWSFRWKVSIWVCECVFHFLLTGFNETRKLYLLNTKCEHFNLYSSLNFRSLFVARWMNCVYLCATIRVLLQIFFWEKYCIKIAVDNSPMRIENMNVIFALKELFACKAFWLRRVWNLRN